MKRMLAASLLLGAVAVALASSAPISALAADDDLGGAGDYPISVTVTDDGTAPAGGSGSSGGSDGFGGSGSGSGSSGFGSDAAAGGSDAVDTGATPSTTSPAAADAAFSLGGLRLGYQWSPWPAEGQLSTSVTLHNGTSTAMPVKLRAWLTGPFDNRIGGPVERTVIVAPKTDRTLQLRVGGVGQWTFITSHLEATPPKSAGGVALKKLTREQGIVIAPWLLLPAVIVVGGCAIGIYVGVRRPRVVVQEAFA